MTLIKGCMAPRQLVLARKHLPARRRGTQLMIMMVETLMIPFSTSIIPLAMQPAFCTSNNYLFGVLRYKIMPMYC
jgi:hypothetical protein